MRNHKRSFQNSQSAKVVEQLRFFKKSHCFLCNNFVAHQSVLLKIYYGSYFTPLTIKKISRDAWKYKSNFAKCFAFFAVKLFRFYLRHYSEKGCVERLMGT